MNKKTTYWTVGIIAALILIVIIWLLAGSRTSSDANEKGDTNGQDTAVVTPAQTDPSENENGQANDAPADDTNANDPHANHGNDNTTDTNSQGSADDQLTAYLEDEQRIMSDMMDGMENIEESGYAATDFLSGMVPHHEAAVAMAKSYLENGAENQQLIDLANAIIETQNKEIEEMNGLIQEYRNADKKDQEKADAYMKEYRDMFDSHHDMHNSSANSVDIAFAEGMLMHHEMAVDMAEDILDYTDEEAVITLANNIITTQKQEIEEMEDILDSLDKD